MRKHSEPKNPFSVILSEHGESKNLPWILHFVQNDTGQSIRHYTFFKTTFVILSERSEPKNPLSVILSEHSEPKNLLWILHFVQNDTGQIIRHYTFFKTTSVILSERNEPKNPLLSF